MNIPGISGLWDSLCDAVCRPPRDDSYTDAALVGGKRATFKLLQGKYYRQDITLVNPRGLKLQCSHYRPCVVPTEDGKLPCVIYCHCNSGSRRDAEEVMFHLLPKGMTVFAFDFSGSGLSEGAYVTLGALEVHDLGTVVGYLREEGSTSTIGLWGRSMGAVTSLLYAERDPSIAGMVLDSPFSRLTDLMMELAVESHSRVPKPIFRMALKLLKRIVKKRAGFSIESVSPLQYVGECFVPALFGHAKDDSFVPKHHSERLYEAYAGDKNFVTFEGDHNSIRPDFFYDSAVIFLCASLRVPEFAPDAFKGPPDISLMPSMSVQPSLRPAGSASLRRVNMLDTAGGRRSLLPPGGNGSEMRPSPFSRPDDEEEEEEEAAEQEEEPDVDDALRRRMEDSEPILDGRPSLRHSLQVPWLKSQLSGKRRSSSSGSGAASEAPLDRHSRNLAREASLQAAVAAVEGEAGPGSPAAAAAGAPGRAGGGGEVEQHAVAVSLLQPMSEEEALQQAMELSLVEAHQRQQADAEAAAAYLLQYNDVMGAADAEAAAYLAQYSEIMATADAAAQATATGAAQTAPAEDEEAQLAEAIAESLRLSKGKQAQRQEDREEEEALQVALKASMRGVEGEAEDNDDSSSEEAGPATAAGGYSSIAAVAGASSHGGAGSTAGAGGSSSAVGAGSSAEVGGSLRAAAGSTAEAAGSSAAAAAGSTAEAPGSSASAAAAGSTAGISGTEHAAETASAQFSRLLNIQQQQMAQQHAGASAAVVRQASMRLQSALSDVADRLAQGGQAGLGGLADEGEDSPAASSPVGRGREAGKASEDMVAQLQRRAAELSSKRSQE